MSDSSQKEFPFVSVVLCTHNPRPAHLEATLASLREQDLPFADWELILVDNCSTDPVAGRFDISWHPGARIVVEKELGLARARLRGYTEASGELVVHSDDDNILATDYLRQARSVFADHPEIGAFGGQLVPRFDREPCSPLERSFGGEVRLDRDVWSNILDDNRTMPFGAGMCLRKEVVRAYLEQVKRDPRRLVLGRTGNRFITGEDIDLNYVAVGLGYGTGLFRALSLIHLIPPERMTAAHIIRYRAGNAYSMVILHYLHFGSLDIPRRPLPTTILFWLRVWTRMTSFDRRKEISMHRARHEAVRDMHAWGWLP